jgi:aldehyde dehydrogenase (NAD+)
MGLEQCLTAPNGRQITLNTGLFIKNSFVAGSASPFVTIDPAHENEICAVQAASANDVDKAVKAARAAFQEPAWRNIRPGDRGALLYRLADLIDENKETLATLEAWDGGKPYSAALNEDVGEVVSTIRYNAGWADKLTGQTITKAGYDSLKFAYTIKQPIGVCAQIIPWNYPLSEL